MFRTRLLSTATATLLLLGLGMGGAGAAFAAEDPAAPAFGDGSLQPSVETDDITVRPAEEHDEVAPGPGDVVEEPVRTCVVAIWQMPRWVDQWWPTWPQSFVSVHPSDCSTTQIDAAEFPVPDTCDTQYQLDRYYASEKTTALLAGGVLQGYGPEEDLVPGTWGTLVHNPDCEIDRVMVTLADAVFVPPVCASLPTSVVLTNDEGVEWTLNGAEVAGNSTHELARGEQSVVIANLEATVAPTGGMWAWSDRERITEWTYTTSAEQGCVASLAASSPSLAATGPTTALGWWGAIALLMTAAGVGAMRTRSRLGASGSGAAL